MAPNFVQKINVLRVSSSPDDKIGKATEYDSWD